MFRKLCGHPSDDDNSYIHNAQDTPLADNPTIIFSPIVHKDRKTLTISDESEADTVLAFPEHMQIPKQRSLSKKAKRFVLCAVFVCLSLGAATLIITASVPSDVDRFMAFWTDSDYDSATAVYSELICGSETATADLSTAIEEYLTAQKDLFANFDVRYTALSDEVTAFEMLNISALQDFLDSYRLEISELNESHISFSLAESSYADEDYAAAIEEYSYVIEEDINYETAQSHLSDSVNLYKDENYDLAEEYFNDGQYTRTIEILNNMLEVLGDDGETSQKINSYNNSYIKQTLNKASAMVSKGKYTEAVDLLEEAYDELPDTRLSDKIEDYTQEYISSVISSARYLADSGDYISALRLLNKTNKNYPSEKLQSAIQKYTSQLYASAVQIYTLSTASQSGFYASSTKIVSSLGGKTYTGCLCFDTSAGSYAEYDLDGQYICLNGYISTGKLTGYSSSMNIEIYVDGDLVFSQNNITRSTSTIPINISLMDSQTLTIKATSNTGTVLDFLYLVDTVIY